jgi:hypothetical protein
MKIIRVYGIDCSGSTAIGAQTASRIPDAIHVGVIVRFDGLSSNAFLDQGSSR